MWTPVGDTKSSLCLHSPLSAYYHGNGHSYHGQRLIMQLHTVNYHPSECYCSPPLLLFNIGNTLEVVFKKKIYFIQEGVTLCCRTDPIAVSKVSPLIFQLQIHQRKKKTRSWIKIRTITSDSWCAREQQGRYGICPQRFITSDKQKWKEKQNKTRTPAIQVSM